MTFLDRLQDTFNKSLDTSRDLLSKAKEKAVDLGDKGVLKFEIVQLENQAEKLFGKLGTVAFKILSESDDHTVSVETPEVKELMQEIRNVRSKITEKEELLKKYQ